MDVDTAIAQARKELLEKGVSEGQWDDPEMVQFLQEAYNDLVGVQEIASSATLQTAVGVEALAFTATMGRIRKVWVRRAPGQGWVDMKQHSMDDRRPDDTNNRGMPLTYFIFNQSFYLIPTPDAIYDIQVLFDLRAPKLVNGTDAIALDTRFEHLPRVYAVARCKQKVDDPAYANYDAQYEAGRRALQAEMEWQRHLQGPRTPRLASGVWD
jgi:hypothetical protein